MKRLLVLGSGFYEKLWDSNHWEIDARNRSPSVLPEPNPDLVVFTGGTDVEPSLYGAKRNHKTQMADAVRDNAEKALFEACVAKSIPMVGICRGAQLGCALSGGSLIQDVDGHHEYHEIICHNNTHMVASSDHHQMMDPKNAEHILLAYSYGLSSGYSDESYMENEFGQTIEPEVVFFPETKFLAHQPHPEWMREDSPYVDYFFETVTQFLEV